MVRVSLFFFFIIIIIIFIAINEGESRKQGEENAGFLAPCFETFCSLTWFGNDRRRTKHL